MADYPHFTQFASLPEAVTAFCQLARENGLNVGLQENMDALRMARLEPLNDRIAFGYALKAICCCSEEERTQFDTLYEWFWGWEKGALKAKTVFKNQSNIQKKTPASLVMMGVGQKQAGQEEEARNVSGANRVERLRKTDFSKIEEMDSELLEEIALKLWKQMSLRLKRKMKSSTTKGPLHLRQIIRSSISTGGDPIRLFRKNKKPRKQRLIVLLDVSGSMDKYSFFLLRFICALRVHFEKVEAFLFSTNLIRITEYLSASNLATTLTVLSAKADNWSSGTKIGACFRDFNEEHAKRMLNGQSTVIILSDGLDTGEPEVLFEEVQKIRRRTKRLIWLNPLKGMRGYEPTQRGMKAALPAVDIFKSAHNLDSILELEKFLLDV